MFTADITLPANWSLLIATAVISLLTGIIAGFYPSRYATSFQPAMVLKGNSGLSPKGKKLRNLLISVQFFASMRKEIGPMLFYLWGSSEQRPFSGSYAYIKLKPGADKATALMQIKAVSEEFDPMYAFNIRPFEQIIDKLYTEEKQLNRLIFLFSFMAVFLSLTGVFGLVVYECEYRRKEIAFRKVLGSTSREIIILFNKTYIRILTVCFLLAVPVASYGTYRWLENFAYKTPMYYWVYGISFFFILTITSLTVTFQSWRAANSNPIKSLKSE